MTITPTAFACAVPISAAAGCALAYVKRWLDAEPRARAAAKHHERVYRAGMHYQCHNDRRRLARVKEVALAQGRAFERADRERRERIVWTDDVSRN